LATLLIDQGINEAEKVEKRNSNAVFAGDQRVGKAEGIELIEFKLIESERHVAQPFMKSQ
jgi:hypothetical protein